ncbi:MAG: hypothetical protein U1C49_01690 [Candidatus Andersenbacteria bacterium]|nr:hypothetical protein [bacterium]MDZ4225538.1 hypothetical protein [Candidatus Andersenbacteria bacterium]
MAEDYEVEPKGLVERIKESPRTVSALIIILIVAAAVYAFSGNKQSDTSDQQATDEEVASEQTNEQSEATTGEETTGEEPAVVAMESVSPQQLAQESQQLPEATRNDQGYAEVAQAGDGVTNLARRATTRWLSENSAGYDVTNEHRIYIEDYIRKNLSSQPLALGQTMTIPYDLTAQAVNEAGNLNSAQLQNLSQYTYVFI